MLLPQREELEIELLKKKNETFKFINGLLALTYIIGAAYGIYKLVGVFI